MDLRSIGVLGNPQGAAGIDISISTALPDAQLAREYPGVVPVHQRRGPITADQQAWRGVVIPRMKRPELTPQSSAGFSEHTDGFYVDLEGEQSTSVCLQEFEHLVPAVLPIKPSCEWPTVNAIGVVTRPDLRMVTDDIEIGNRRQLKNGRSQRVLNFLSPIQRVQQIADSVAHPRRKNDVGGK